METVRSFWAPCRLVFWWIVPALWLLYVFLVGHSAATARRYPTANGVAGEILPGGSIGQSFVSRYSNLSGVEVQIGTYKAGSAPANASLIFHLRAAPTPGPDLATVSLPVGEPLGENPWYLFSFPPVGDSQDKPYYIEIESPDGERGKALTLFWGQHFAGSDPYPYGTAYRNSQPQAADLAFGLHYVPSPADTWAQLARGASTNMPVWMMLTIALAAILGALGCARLLPAILRDGQRTSSWLARWSLPLVLVVALAHGGAYLLLVPPWQGPDEHQHFAYAALLDRYNLDHTRVQQIAQASLAEGKTDASLAQAIEASMAEHDFSRRVIGYSNPGAPVRVGTGIFYQVRQPPTYYWLGAVAIGAMRSVGLESDPYASPDAALRTVRAVSLALSLAVVGLAWLAGVILSPDPKKYWLRLVLPLTVALMPMHAFAATVANNDIMAELLVSALFVVLAALLRWHTGVKGVAMVLLAILLTLAGAAAKSTALAASVPLLGLGLMTWGGMLAIRAVERRHARGDPVRLPVRSLWVPFSLTAALLLACVGVALVAYKPAGTAAGWQTRSRPLKYAPQRESQAHHGSHVMELGGPHPETTARQVVLPPVYHPALVLNVSGWARRADKGEALGGITEPIRVNIRVEEGVRNAGISEKVLDPGGAWTPYTFTARISQSAEPVLLRLALERSDVAVQFDDLALSVEQGEIPWRNPIFSLDLVNPSAERETLELQPPLASVLPEEVEQMASVVANPQPFDKEALLSYYADLQYRSFWGLFGWVSVPLPEMAYMALGVVTLLALIGLAGAGMRRLGVWSWHEWLGLISVAAFAVAILVGFGRQMARLVTEGVLAYPQGRYLFVMTLPVAWFLIRGVVETWSFLGEWGGKLGSRFGRLQSTDSQAVEGSQNAVPSTLPLPWGVWLGMNGLFLFAAFSIIALIVPYYYG